MNAIDYIDKVRALKWREVTMLQAIHYAQVRSAVDPPAPSVSMFLGGDYTEPGVIMFDDGTAIACTSEWSGPYSCQTPDADADPPRWFIGGKP